MSIAQPALSSLPYLYGETQALGTWARTAYAGLLAWPTLANASPEPFAPSQWHPSLNIVLDRGTRTGLGAASTLFHLPQGIADSVSRCGKRIAQDAQAGTPHWISAPGRILEGFIIEPATSLAKGMMTLYHRYESTDRLDWFLLGQLASSLALLGLPTGHRNIRAATVEPVPTAFLQGPAIAIALPTSVASQSQVAALSAPLLATGYPRPQDLTKIPDPRTNPEEKFIEEEELTAREAGTAERIRRLQEAVQDLPPLEQTILTHIYGLDGRPPRSVQEIARSRKFTVEGRLLSEKEIRTLYHRAFIQLKIKLDPKGLPPPIDKLAALPNRYKTRSAK